MSFFVVLAVHNPVVLQRTNYDYSQYMNYTIVDFLALIGSLGLFIYGMKLFSDGLQKIAGDKLRAILKGMTTNRVAGVGTGFLSTVVTQSSTTTTVMVVSFVNAGLLTFIESTGVIMGANIGTTVTAWMVAVFGFQFNISTIAIILIGFAVPFLFLDNPRLNHYGEAAIGFSILFIGLQFIKESVPSIEENPEMLAFLDQFTDLGFGTVLIFVFVGTLLTLITQSSSAATTITLVMLFEGWIDFPIAAAMILGENIGTTITANVASIVGNVYAKRAARFHLVFNLIGVVWMLSIITPFLHGVDGLMNFFAPEAPSVFEEGDLARSQATLAISLFHTAFNVLNVVLLFAFVPFIIKFVEWVQPVTKASDEEFRLQYIRSGLLSSPELSIEQARKEIEQFAKLIEKMHYSFNALFFKKQKKQQKFLKKIRKREEISDEIELEVGDYLTRISENSNLSQNAQRRVRTMHMLINELERITDIYYQMSKSFEQMQSREIYLSEEAVRDLKQLLDTVLEAIQNMRVVLEEGRHKLDLDYTIDIEKRIDQLRDDFKTRHFDRLESGNYSVKAGVYFLDFINRLERIGDHILNVVAGADGKKMKQSTQLEIADEP